MSEKPENKTRSTSLQPRASCSKKFCKKTDKRSPHAGELAYCSGALQYAARLEPQHSSPERAAYMAPWDPLQASLQAVQRLEAFQYAFPPLHAGSNMHAAEECWRWLAFLLQSARERLVLEVALGDINMLLAR